MPNFSPKSKVAPSVVDRGVIKGIAYGADLVEKLKSAGFNQDISPNEKNAPQLESIETELLRRHTDLALRLRPSLMAFDSDYVAKDNSGRPNKPKAFEIAKALILRCAEFEAQLEMLPSKLEAAKPVVTNRIIDLLAIDGITPCQSKIKAALEGTVFVAIDPLNLANLQELSKLRPDPSQTLVKLDVFNMQSNPRILEEALLAIIPRRWKQAAGRISNPLSKSAWLNVVGMQFLLSRTDSEGAGQALARLLSAKIPDLRKGLIAVFLGQEPTSGLTHLESLSQKFRQAFGPLAISRLNTVFDAMSLDSEKFTKFLETPRYIDNLRTKPGWEIIKRALGIAPSKSAMISRFKRRVFSAKPEYSSATAAAVSVQGFHVVGVNSDVAWLNTNRQPPGTPQLLACLADGVTGRGLEREFSTGLKAAKATVAELIKAIPQLTTESDNDLAAALKQALLKARKVMTEMAKEIVSLYGSSTKEIVLPSTTVVGIFELADRLVLFSVGDSRIALIGKSGFIDGYESPEGSQEFVSSALQLPGLGSYYTPCAVWVKSIEKSKITDMGEVVALLYTDGAEVVMLEQRASGAPLDIDQILDDGTSDTDSEPDESASVDPALARHRQELAKIAFDNRENPNMAVSKILQKCLYDTVQVVAADDDGAPDDTSVIVLNLGKLLNGGH